MEPVIVILACTGLLLALSAPVAGFYAGRRASIDAYSDLSIAFDKERAATAILRDEVLEMLERSQVERRRIVGERARIQQTEKAQAPAPGGNGDPLQVGDGRDAQIMAVRARYEHS